MKQLVGVAVLGFVAAALVWQAPASGPDKRLAKAWRSSERAGWIRVHLEGTPAEIGYQHGYLLAEEIDDLRRVTELQLTHDGKGPYSFFRTTAETILWPRIEQEYREELQAIAEGARARGSKIDVLDIVVMNATLELGYYIAVLDGKPAPAERCTALVATGRYTRDGRVVIGHSNWTGYLDGARWKIIFDVVPSRGHRIFMDGMPGWIHSGDDFGVNSAGIAITETTITQFIGFDTAGIAEFVRARKAMQYSSSIDDFVRIMKEGNNGGYANNWLVADSNTNEVADLELGLKNVNVWRTRDGYYAGTNFPVSEKLAREETKFDLKDMGLSANARRVRATELIENAKGTIDVPFAKKYLSDHYDSFQKKEDPNERSLCGHIDLSPRGLKPWQDEFGAAGTVQAKAADHKLLRDMSFIAAFGHPCGIAFKAAAHLKAHPEFNWQAPLLRDLPSFPWTQFRMGVR
ncbi:MAG TPA: C45 family peptidase [Bryobacteraceae bacterium]|nr:C45 family peptidase [Bryobacteraceae bacterium]